MRLIDADALTETLTIVAKMMAKSDAQKALMGRVLNIIEHRHEEVVRCRYCKYRAQNGNCEHPRHFNGLPAAYPNDFCSYGERKDGDVV